MNGYSVENLNEGQYEFLTQFRKNVADILPNNYPDAWLIKWLRNHNYNLKKTEALFRANMRMREVYQLDTIAETYVKPQVISKYEFTTPMGFAKNGSPIRYTRFGVADLIGYIMSLSGYEISLYSSYLIEYDLALIRKENEKNGGRLPHEVTYVIDMEGFSIQMVMNKGLIETALDLLQIMQDHYPEIWGNILVVNAPGYFDRVFNIFKPILRLNMLQKIRVASRDSTRTLLLKYIDEEELPKFLGGKRTDSRGDPNCSEFIPSGGPVPEEYYLKNSASLLRSTDEGATSTWVSARSVFNYAAVVRKPNSQIRVQFRTEIGSIGFKMLFRPFGEDPNHLDLPACNEYLDESQRNSDVLYVSPPVRMQTHFSPIDQLVRAPWPGIYIFRFDNTHSWFRSRKVVFRIRVVRDDN